MASRRTPNRRSVATTRMRVAVCSALIGLTLASCSATTSATGHPTGRPVEPGVPRGHPTTTVGPSASASAPTTTTTAPPAPASWSLVTEPEDGLQPIYSLVSSARHHLDMTMYELADPRAVSLLEADAARGVAVRVLLDRDDSGASVNAAAYSALQSAGVQVRWAPAGTIFHQKTITVDDHTSAIMTLNLTSEYYADTRDFAVVTTDPSDVAAIEEVFASDWNGGSAPPESSTAGPDLVWSPGAEPALVALIGTARHSLLVENEEMDDSDVVAALEAAARRGVVVDVVMTWSSSWIGELDALVAAGVQVRTYATDAALYIHAKAVVVDGSTAFVGSQNFSASSLDDNRELGVVTGDSAIVAPLGGTITSDFRGGDVLSGTGSGGGTPAAAVPAPSPVPAPVPAPAPAPAPAPQVGAWCRAGAAPADDGYAGDVEVSITSDEPDRSATASDAGDTYSRDTDGSGSASVTLWHQSPGETITVTVGGATCTTGV